MMLKREPQRRTAGCMNKWPFEQARATRCQSFIPPMHK